MRKDDFFMLLLAILLPAFAMAQRTIATTTPDTLVIGNLSIDKLGKITLLKNVGIKKSQFVKPNSDNQNRTPNLDSCTLRSWSVLQQDHKFIIVAAPSDKTTALISKPGGPIKGIDVKLGKNPGGGIQAKVSSVEGSFEFPNLEPGEYELKIINNGASSEALCDFRLEFYIANVNNAPTLRGAINTSRSNIKTAKAAGH